jgi:4-oxalocrotonate tautomerase
MPHVVVKMLPGRSEEQKARIAGAVARAIVDNAGCGEDAVSVGIEEVAKEQWAEAVYRPEIRGRWDTLYRKPGYDPL